MSTTGTDTAAPSIQPTLSAYINPLSDFLFVAARVITRRDGDNEAL
nr:hypothetical protein [Simiduia aestuariiviva]